MEFNNKGISIISQPQFDADLVKPLQYTAKAAIELEVGSYNKAITSATEGQIEARKAGTILDELQCAVYEAQANIYLGNLPYALGILEAARQLAVSSGLEGSDRDLGVLDLMAEVAYEKSDYLQAYNLYRCIAEQTSPIRSPRYHIYACLSLIDIETMISYARERNITKIIHLRELSNSLDWNHGLLLSDILTANVLLSGNSGNSVPSLHIKCFESARNANNTQLMFKCLDKLGDRSTWPDNALERFNWIGIYFALARKCKHLSHTYRSLLFLGDICVDEWDNITALALFHVVLEGAMAMGIWQCQADCMYRIGDILNTRGSSEDAEIYWENARHVYSDHALRKGITEMDAPSNLHAQ
ncbi:hypothetical protein B0H13DRAFT_160638 [Mycena leptocephala]|nr:hypothetical protein B0H13DRAFT_160638 [Mycena leptocephala]